MADRFLLTGALGCIGAWVTRNLVREGLEPVVLDYCVGLARAPYHTHRWCGHVSAERQPGS